MLQALAGIIVIVAMAVLVGGGWARGLQTRDQESGAKWLFHACVLAATITGVIWCWASRLQITVGAVAIAVALIGALGWVTIGRGRGVPRINAKRRNRAVVILGAFLLCGFAAAGTQAADGQDLTWRNRLGPDSLGYATSAQVLATGQTRESLISSIEEQTGHPVQEIFAPGSKLVGNSPSITTGVASEFLIGADRWGMVGAIAIPLSILGAGATWSLLAIFSAFAIAVTALGIWVIVRERSTGGWAFGAVVLWLFNASVLNAWLEGGNGEMWVMPMCVLLIGVAVSMPSVNLRRDIVLTAIGVAGIASAYPDAGVVYALTIAVMCVLMLFVLGRKMVASLLIWPTGAILGCLALGPFSLSLMAYVTRRSGDAAVGGWWQPYWMSVAEIVGVGNAYPKPATFPVTRSELNDLFTVLASFAMLGVLIGWLVRALRSVGSCLLVSAATVAATLTIKTNYIDHSNNYQSMKLVSMLAPAFAIGLALLAHSAWLTTTSGEYGKTAQRFTKPLFVLMVVAVALSGTSWLVEFFRGATVLPADRAIALGTNDARSNFEASNVIAPLKVPGITVAAQKIRDSSVGAQVPLTVINWNEQARLRAATLPDRPLLQLVMKSTCPDLCENVKPDRIAWRGGDLLLVELAPSSEPFTQPNLAVALRWLKSAQNKSGL